MSVSVETVACLGLCGHWGIGHVTGEEARSPQRGGVQTADAARLRVVSGAADMQGCLRQLRLSCREVRRLRTGSHALCVCHL